MIFLFKFLSISLGIMLFFSACSSRYKRVYQPHNTKKTQTKQSSKAKKTSSKKQTQTTTKKSTTPNNLSKLYAQYKAYKGTPYRLGGTSKHGIDCSGFAQLTFRNKFNIHLERTTREQIKMGYKISKSALRSGDLVFFKTSWRSLHVGIYLEDSKFLHASTSQGVTISNLNEGYWRNKYIQSRRIK